MACDNLITFTNGQYLTNSCDIKNHGSQQLSNLFTNISEISITCNSSQCAKLCEFTDSNMNGGIFTNLYNNGSYQLDSSKYYLMSSSSVVGLNVVIDNCITLTPREEIRNKLNNISTNQIYNEINPIIPFLIFLVIFSFSFFVLKKVVRSSSKGNINI